MPLEVKSESLGHSSIAVTNAIYANFLDQPNATRPMPLEAYVGAAMTPPPKTFSES